MAGWRSWRDCNAPSIWDRIHSGPASFDPTPFVRSSKSLLGAYGYTVETWQRAIALFSKGLIHPEAVISHRVALEKADLLESVFDRRCAVKVLVQGSKT